MAVAKTTSKADKNSKRPSVTLDTDNVVPMNADIAQQLDVLRADIKLLAETVKQQALSKVEVRTETAKTVAAEQKDAAVARYDELTTKAETQIREKPISSMAIAVGAGLVLGAILRG